MSWCEAQTYSGMNYTDLVTVGSAMEKNSTIAFAENAASLFRGSVCHELRRTWSWVT